MELSHSMHEYISANHRNESLFKTEQEFNNKYIKYEDISKEPNGKVFKYRDLTSDKKYVAAKFIPFHPDY